MGIFEDDLLAWNRSQVQLQLNQPTMKSLSLSGDKLRLSSNYGMVGVGNIQVLFGIKSFTQSVHRTTPLFSDFTSSNVTCMQSPDFAAHKSNRLQFLSLSTPAISPPLIIDGTKMPYTGQ